MQCQHKMEYKSGRKSRIDLHFTICKLFTCDKSYRHSNGPYVNKVKENKQKLYLDVFVKDVSAEKVIYRVFQTKYGYMVASLTLQIRYYLTTIKIHFYRYIHFTFL